MEIIYTHNGAGKIEIDGDTVKTYTRDDIDGGFGPWKQSKVTTMTVDLRARLDALKQAQNNQPTTKAGRI